MRAVIRPLRKGSEYARRKVRHWAATQRRLTLSRTSFIGITGSAGKTTAVTLTAAILSSAGKSEAGLVTTPEQASQALLALDRSVSFYVQEVHANHLGVIGAYLRILRPQIGVVTTIGTDHYKIYRGPEATAREKGRLIESLSKRGIAVLNADDPHVLAMAVRSHAPIITYGRSETANVRATDVTAAWPDRLSFNVSHAGESILVRTNLVGEHWVTAVLAAITTGISCGLGLSRCASAVKEVEPVFGRYSVHPRSDGAVFVLDTHKAPLSTIAAGVSFVRNARVARKTIVFGTISDYAGKGGRVHRGAAREALQAAGRVIFVGPHSGHVEKLRQGELRDRLFAFQTNYEASSFLKRTIVAGELIYVKASITDHLERIMLAELDEVVCWRERCGKWAPCIDCENYRVPIPPPFGLRDTTEIWPTEVQVGLATHI